MAQRHDITVLKIQFTLSPFSFVFIIHGEKEYHVILETLDSEEATYIWHIHKDSEGFQEQLTAINKAIIQMQSEGCQAYLDSNPERFSQILHDYSDAKKGFVLWKSLIEQRIN